MEIIGMLLFIFTALRLVVSAFNFFSKPYLPENVTLDREPSVSVLISVCNQERNIGRLLDDLAEIGYHNMEIIVYGENITSRTLEAVTQRQQYLRITVLKGENPEKGWTGKNYAYDILARKSKGNYLIFMDVDVRVGGNFIPGAVKYMVDNDISLLSMFPCQIMTDMGSRITVPLLDWLLLSLVPVKIVEKFPDSSITAVNGEFLMFRREDYFAVRPHNVCRRENVTDLAIVELYRNCCYKTAVLLGSHDVYCRMYRGLRESVRGIARTVFDFFGRVEWLGYLFLIGTTLAPFIIFIYNGVVMGLIYLAMIVLIRVFVSLASHQSITRNILYIIPQQILLGVIMISATLSRIDRERG
ncbi:MAG: glycosyltransferase [Rikenellaceae bacterium]|nr:glycosyltransferase [Rikenellaceae bacterium]